MVLAGKGKSQQRWLLVIGSQASTCDITLLLLTHQAIQVKSDFSSKLHAALRQKDAAQPQMRNNYRRYS